MSKGVHNIAFYVSPDPECSRTTQNSKISLAPSRGCILYAIYGNSTCVINHIVVTAIDSIRKTYILLYHAFSCFIMLYHAFSCFSVKAREKYKKSNPPYFSKCLRIWLKK